MKIVSWLAVAGTADSALKNSLRAHRVSEICAPLEALAQHADCLRQSDVLLIWADRPGETDWLALEQALPHLPPAGCVLVCEVLSAPQLRRAMRAGVRLVLERPLATGALHDELARIAGQLPRDGGTTARVMTFCSAGGGSGASLVAANFAAACATLRRERVLLLDVCQGFASCHLYLTQTPPTRTVLDLCAQVARLDAALFAAGVVNVMPGFDLLPGPADPISSNDMAPDQIDALLALACRMYDLIVIDIGQRFNPLSIGALDRSDRVGVVLQATLSHLAAAHRLCEMLSGLDVSSESTGLWLNRYDARRAELKPAAIGSRLGYATLAVLPDDPAAVAESALQGRPLLACAGQSALSRALRSAVASHWPSSPVPVPSRWRWPFAST
jgi:pilus assembly protein CpaE